MSGDMRNHGAPLHGWPGTEKRPTKRRPGRWAYGTCLGALAGSVAWAMHLHPMVRACGDSAVDGGLYCTYESLTGPRFAVILLGVLAAALIWVFVYAARRESKPD
jgi:hypothetical protein